MLINTDIDVCVDALCDVCGGSLETTEEDSSDGDITIRLKMCEDCTTEIHNDSHSEGYAQGVEESNAEISAAIDAELKDFDFKELFKQSTQYGTIKEAIQLIEMHEDAAAAILLQGLM